MQLLHRAISLLIQISPRFSKFPPKQQTGHNSSNLRLHIHLSTGEMSDFARGCFKGLLYTVETLDFPWRCFRALLYLLVMVDAGPAALTTAGGAYWPDKTSLSASYRRRISSKGALMGAGSQLAYWELDCAGWLADMKTWRVLLPAPLKESPDVCSHTTHNQERANQRPKAGMLGFTSWRLAFCRIPVQHEDIARIEKRRKEARGH